MDHSNYLNHESIEILVVEDSITQSEQLRYILERQGFVVSVVTSGDEALEFMEARVPTIVITDIIMPGMDGYALCRRIREDERLKDVPVVLLTSLSDPEDVIRGLESRANHFMTKPYEESFLMSRLRSILINENLRAHTASENTYEVFFAGKRYRLEWTMDRRQILDFLLSTYENAVQKNLELIKTRDEFKSLNEQLEIAVQERTAALVGEIEERKRAEKELKLAFENSRRTLEGTVMALATLAEKRDPYTAGHQQRVAKLAADIARRMGLSDRIVESVRVAGILHDIGKIYVPPDILNKPGRLSDIEMILIRTHTQVGADIVKMIPFEWPVAEIMIQHHEKLDGSGYPFGLSGSEILLEARILSVADVVEAMASHRPYRPALGIDKALEEISINRGVFYDAQVVDACLALFKDENYQFE
ncbi:MAG: HD domain-containing phosphohydrolase [Solirubrobacterales bacterium]